MSTRGMITVAMAFAMVAAVLAGCSAPERGDAGGTQTVVSTGAGPAGTDAGAPEALAYPEGYECVFNADCGWQQEAATKEMNSALSTQPEIHVVFGHNDPSAYGAYLAAQQEGEGREEQIKFIGIDGLAHEGINSWRWDRMTYAPRTGEAHAAVDLDPWDEVRDAWLITPRLAPSAENHIFGFYAFSGGGHDGGEDYRFNVVLSTTTPDVSSFTHILATNVQTGSMGNYMRHTYDLSDYIGQNIYIGVYTVSEGWVSLSFDDFFGPPIVPEESSGFEVEATITGSNVVLQWEAVPEATGYKVYASEDPYSFGPDPIATVDTNSYTTPITAPIRFFRIIPVIGE